MNKKYIYNEFYIKYLEMTSYPNELFGTITGFNVFKCRDRYLCSFVIGGDIELIHYDTDEDSMWTIRNFPARAVDVKYYYFVKDHMRIWEYGDPGIIIDKLCYLQQFLKEKIRNIKNKQFRKEIIVAKYFHDTNKIPNEVENLIKSFIWSPYKKYNHPIGFLDTSRETIESVAWAC
jgi:hypothetical protein